MIEAVHLCKRYGAQTAVEDIHFSVSPGEIVGLIGHNGSGKTTTMRMLTGCLEPTSGDVLIDGQSLLRHAELKKQIGYLPEIPPLYPEMTVNEQMCFAAGLRGLTGKAAKDAITTALRQLHVEEVRGRLIRNLSKATASASALRRQSSARRCCSCWMSRPSASTPAKSSKFVRLYRSYPRRTPFCSVRISSRKLPPAAPVWSF